MVQLLSFREEKTCFRSAASAFRYLPKNVRRDQHYIRNDCGRSSVVLALNSAALGKAGELPQV